MIADAAYTGVWISGDYAPTIENNDISAPSGYGWAGIVVDPYYMMTGASKGISAEAAVDAIKRLESGKDPRSSADAIRLRGLQRDAGAYGPEVSRNRLSDQVLGIFAIVADGAQISENAIEGPGQLDFGPVSWESAESWGILNLDSYGGQISNNSVSGVDDGIDVSGSLYISISQNDLVGWGNAEAGSGIGVEGSYDVAISGNKVQKFGDGISASWVESATVENNIVLYSVQKGLGLMGVASSFGPMDGQAPEDGAAIKFNRIYNAENTSAAGGISVGDGSSLTVRNNTIIGPDGFGRGISSSGGSSVDTRNNIISGFDAAVYAETETASSLTSNYNLFWNNVADYVNVDTGTGEVYEDPLFAVEDTASPDFLALQSIRNGFAADSPAIDAGDPADLAAPGDWRIDIGAIQGYVEGVAPTTGFDVELGTSEATVTLTAVDNISGVASTKYRTKLGDGSWGAWVESTENPTSFHVAGDGLYTVEYYSVDNVGNEEAVKTGTFTVADTAPTPPTDPTDLTIDRTDNVFHLTWAASTDNVGVEGYEIERSLSGSGGWSLIGTTSATSYDDAIAAPDQAKTYHYRVRAYDADGNRSGYASASAYMPDLTAPTAPSDIIAVRYGLDIGIIWSASTDNVGVKGYEVERSVNGGAWTKIGTTATTVYEDRISLADPSAEYRYRVRAYDDAGLKSAYSDVATALYIPISVGDITGDMASDAIAFYDYGGATAALWGFESAPTSENPLGIKFVPWKLWSSGSGMFDSTKVQAVSGDFDGDGKIDVMALYDYGGTTSGIFYFKSAGSSMASPVRVFFSRYWTAGMTKLAAGDFDSDGRDEIMAFYNYGGTSTGVWIFDTNADGTLKYPTFIFYSPYWDWNSTTLISVRDGAKSKVIASYDYGDAGMGLWKFELKSDGKLAYPTRIFYSTTWDAGKTKFASEDVNADGNGDLVAFYDNGGSTTRAWLFESTGTGFSAPRAFFSSSTWSVSRTELIAGDFDADGFGDIGAVYDYGTGIGVFVFASNGSAPSSPVRVYYSPYWDGSKDNWIMPY